MEFEDMDLEQSATQGGMKKFGQILAIGIILIVAGFGDVMYLQLMGSHFPTGFLMVLCYVGAFTSFLAVAYMLIGKSILFTPGLQMVVAWFVFLIELALIGMNIVLVFQGDGANSTGFLAAWLQMAPATPVINMAGVAILFFLDEEGKMRHEDMELAWEMKRANRRHFKATSRARLRLQNKQLNFLVTEMDRAVASPESMEAIRLTAIEMNQHLLGQLSGGRTYRVPPALPAGSAVESDPLPPTPPTLPSRTPTPEPEKQPNWFQRTFSRSPEPTQTNSDAQYAEFLEWKKQQATTQFAQPSPTEHETVTGPISAPLALPGTDGFDEMARQLPPLVVAPNHNGNGASQNGHK